MTHKYLPSNPDMHDHSSSIIASPKPRELYSQEKRLNALGDEIVSSMHNHKCSDYGLPSEIMNSEATRALYGLYLVRENINSSTDYCSDVMTQDEFDEHVAG